jgi:hypothetical protein
MLNVHPTSPSVVKYGNISTINIQPAINFTLEQDTKAQRGGRLGMGGQRHSSAALHPPERPGTHCIGGWVGHRAGLDG